MTKAELIYELSSLSRQDFTDVIMCLMDDRVLSVNDILEARERLTENRLRKYQEIVAEAEGHVYEMLFPCLYDTKQLSERSKDIVSHAISFVRKQGLHATDSYTKMLNKK